MNPICSQAVVTPCQSVQMLCLGCSRDYSHHKLLDQQQKAKFNKTQKGQCFLINLCGTFWWTFGHFSKKRLYFCTTVAE